MSYVTYTNTVPYTEIIDTPGWNAGARSITSFDGDGGFSFTTEQDTGIVAGLNTQDRNVNYLEIQHGFYITNGRYRIVELGVTKTPLVSYTTAAVFKITRVLGVVRYYVNDVLIYTSATLSTGSVFLDSSLYSYQDRICNTTFLFSESRINIQLSRLDAFGIQGSNDNFCAAELFPLTTTIEITDVNRIVASTLPLQAIASVEQHQFISCELEPLTASGSADSLLVPEYNAINVELRPLQVYGLRYDPDPATLDVEISALEAFGADFDINLIQGEFLPIQASLILGLSDLLYATWPRPSFTIKQISAENGNAYGYLRIPAPILTARANDDDNAQLALTIPAPILTAQTGAVARLTLPAPTLTATGTVQAFASATLEVPAPELTATASTQVGATVELEVPAPTLTAATGAYASLEVLAPILTATGSVEHLARVALTLPFIELTATAKVGTLALVELEIPSPSLEATGIVGAVAHATLVLPAIILTAIGRVSPGIGIAATALATETTYAINLTTGAVTNLLLGEIDRLVTAHGRLYGLRGEELVRLDGDLDGATTIPAMIRFAPQTFGSNRTKRANTVYLSSREDDGLTLELIEDESRVWRYQTATDTALAYGTHKVKVGRGVKFHTAGLAVYNRNGGRMDIGGIEVLVDTHAPRPKS